MSRCFIRVATAAAVTALAACSANTSAGAPLASGAAVSSVTLPSGEHVVRVGSQTIRFGGHAEHLGRRNSWITPASKKKTWLYGSSYDGDFINIYPAKGTNQQPIGQLSSGLTSPQGMFVDKRHRLWVANTNAFGVVAFKRGATTPFTTLSDPNYYPISVVADSHGTVFAANAEGTSGPPGNVTFWKKGSTTPSGTLTYSNFLIVLGIGVDANDNIYVSYVPTSGPPAVVEFPAGSQTAQPLSIADTTISQITFDNSANLVMETEYNTLGVWAPPYSGGPSRTLPIFGNSPTLNKKNSDVWIAYANFSNPMIEEYDYNSGTLLDTITAGFTTNAIPYDVALDPPAKP